MSQIPFIEREVKKNIPTIPSREFIIDHLLQHNSPISHKKLINELGIKGDKQLKDFYYLLTSMTSDGELILTKHRRYILSKHLNIFQGKVIGHRDGFGFLRVNGSKKDYYLSVEQMRTVIHGDIVIAQSQQVTNNKFRRKVNIVRVIITKDVTIVGRFFLSSGIFFVVPNDLRFSFNIIIPPKMTNKAKIGYVVVVKLIQRPNGNSKAIGKITEILGKKMNTEMAINIALRSHNIPSVWPSEIEKQLANFDKIVPETAKYGRIDLRMLPLVTIDGENSRDFDDAVYCEKQNNGGWRLWVAVSDVSYYVRPYTLLDKEASRRSTSVYFPSEVIPMIPEVLSNGLCSLIPQEDRLCLVCEIFVSQKGYLTSYKFYEAIIKSHARLTYNQAWQIISENQKLHLYYSSLVQLYKMYQMLTKARLQRGGLFFESEEAIFIFDRKHRIERIEYMKRNSVHKLIEECMILANIAAANFVKNNKEPALYRVHDRPSYDQVISLRSILSSLGLSLGGGDKPEPKDYAYIMNMLSVRPDYKILQTMLLRSMKQANYDHENRGHFGLALQSYAHFTSPIRRYPDLALQRTIKYLIDPKKKLISNRSTSTGGWHYELTEILYLSQQCSLGKTRADQATKDVEDWLKCNFMQDYIGQMFIGTIINVMNFGFFVRLREFFIEGLVHISLLNNDYYRYDSIGHRLISESGDNIYSLGDDVKIRVKEIKMDSRKIIFSLISNSI